MKPNFTYVTLLSTDSYLMGVLLLEQMLRKVNSKYPLYVLCSDVVSEESLRVLKKQSIQYKRLDEHIIVEGVSQSDPNQQHWNFTFDKLYVWTLTEYDKIVYVDSDMQIIENIDEIFDYPSISAVRADVFNCPDVKGFNSGLMVLTPNMKDFEGMKNLWTSGKLGNRHVGDQDVINEYCANTSEGWRFLPFAYNILYSEVSAGVIKREDVEPVKVIHYIGERKPWMVSPLALYRRMRHNFLWKYLLQYALLIFQTRIKLRLNV